MRRRALLASLAANATGIVGCAGLLDESSPAARTTTASPSTSQPATATLEPERPTNDASLIELETVSLAYSLGPTYTTDADGTEVALWFDRTATADHPARLTGWLRNGSDDEREIEIKWLPLIGKTESRQPPGHGVDTRLYAAPTENNEIADVVPAVARNDEGLWHVSETGNWMLERRQFDPGEVVALEYVLVGHPDVDQRPVESHEFEGRGETITLHTWQTDLPDPADTSRFAGRSPPSIETDRTVQWYHEADRARGAFVEPSSERVAVDETVEFDLVNHTASVLECDAWNLYKFDAGEWFHVGPYLRDENPRTVRPGTHAGWALRVFGGPPVYSGSLVLVNGYGRGFLGGGEYAAVTNGGHAKDWSAAMFEVSGETVELSPTDDAVIDRDGDETTVTTERHGDPAYPPDQAFKLERVESADERLIVEQIMVDGRDFDRDRGLRNALAVIEPDVERVLVRGDEFVVNWAVGVDEETRRFRFRGQAYEATRVTSAD